MWLADLKAVIWGIGGMVDTLVLGTSAPWRAGSSPVFPTIAQEEIDSIQLGSTALYKWAKPITIFANSIYRRRS